jgi:hypothetical protein
MNIKQAKKLMKKKLKEVKEYKKSDVGIKGMIEINRKRIKNGLIAFILGIVFIVVMYTISGVIDSIITYIFYGTIFWGLIGLSVYKTKERKNNA